MSKPRKQSEPANLRTLVCMTCGGEQFFDGMAAAPSSVTCTKCSGTVFRAFDTTTQPDEAQLEQLEETRRSAAWGDSSPDTTRDDLRDLDGR